MKTKRRLKRAAAFALTYLRLKNLPIIIKLLITFTLLISIILILSVVTFNNYRRDKETSTLSVIKQMNIQCMDKIDSTLEDLINITRLPLQYSKEEVDKTSGNRLIEQLDRVNKTNASTLEFEIEVERIAYSILNFKKYIQSVFVYGLNGLSEQKIKGGTLSPPGFNPLKEKWFDNCLKGLGKPEIINTFRLPNISDVNTNSVYVFSVARALVKIPESETVGVLLVNCKTEYIEGILKSMMFVPGQRMLIMDGNGAIVCDTSGKRFSSSLETEVLEALSDNKDKTVKLDGTEYLISTASSRVNSWIAVNIIPTDELFKSIDHMRNATAVITFILLLAALITIFFMSRQIVNPVKKLVLLMKLFEREDFNVKVKLSRRDEIGQLAKTFNYMTLRIRKLIKEVYVDRIKQKDLEIQMLQIQINPHFLYNTLESIHMMAEINKDKETSRMAASLGKLLRYSTGKSKDMVTVREEIEHLKDYIMLQELRFDDIFRVSVNIDPLILDCPMLKMILQPILENAIYHGMRDLENDGSITVTGCKKDENIVFEVTDNGKGMGEDILAALNDYINGYNESFHSIGLKNVNKRIKLFYGDKYGVLITSIPGTGTTVRTILPCS